MIIGQGKVEMDKKKLDTIKEWKPPTTIKGVWLFTGFTNFYCKFIPNFSNIIAPLYYNYLPSRDTHTHTLSLDYLQPRQLSTSLCLLLWWPVCLLPCPIGHLYIPVLPFAFLLILGMISHYTLGLIHGPISFFIIP